MVAGERRGGSNTYRKHPHQASATMSPRLTRESLEPLVERASAMPRTAWWTTHGSCRRNLDTNPHRTNPPVGTRDSKYARLPRWICCFQIATSRSYPPGSCLGKCLPQAPVIRGGPHVWRGRFERVSWDQTKTSGPRADKERTTKGNKWTTGGAASRGTGMRSLIQT